MIKNIFLMPFPIIQSFMGAPDGTGMISQGAELKGVKLSPSEKTIRKILKDPGSVSERSRLKFKNFISNLEPGLLDCLPDEDDLPERMFVTFSSLQWRAALSGIRFSRGRTLFPDTLDFIESLIDSEDALFKEIVGNKEPVAKLESILRSDLSKTISSEVYSDVENILEQVKKKPSDEIEVFLRNSRLFIEYMIFSMISILMRIIARAEIEWSQSFKYDIYELEGQRYLARFLPLFDDSYGIVQPIRRLLMHWREINGFSSWEEMAASLPGDSDISDKKRKLMGWCAGDHIPEEEDIKDWLFILFPEKTDEGIYRRYLNYSFYEVAAFMNRLLSEFMKANKKLRRECLIGAFNTFNRHFDELREAPAGTGASART